jgi:hypothetical protein
LCATHTDIYTYEEKIYFQKLALVIVRTGKSEICRANQHAGNSAKVLGYSLEVEFLILWEISI